MNTQAQPSPALILNDKIVSMREAAAITGLSVSTLKRQTKGGGLKIIRLSPRRVGLRLSALYSWLDDRAA
jgi:predicted DNA-binding transcriptional regulator AlpA